MDTPEQEDADAEALIRRLETLLAQRPAMKAVILHLLHNLEKLEDDGITEGAILEFYRFCKQYPDMALILNTIAQADRPAQG